MKTSKNLSILSLSIILAACGGGGGSSSSDSGEQSQGEKPVAADNTVTNQYNAELCGSGLVLNASSVNIGQTAANVKAKMNSDDGAAVVSGSAADVCIDGNLLSLEVSGSAADVYVSGNVGTVTISASSADVVVYGEIGYLNITGSTVDVWAGTVGSYDDSGQANDIMNVSQLPAANN